MTARRLFAIGFLGLIFASAPANASAQTPSSPAAGSSVWVPTTVVTTTTLVPCSQANQVCKVITTSTSEGHWQLSPSGNRTAGAYLAGSCLPTAWDYTKQYQDNVAYNLLGARVWEDDFTAMWGYNWCNAYLYHWWHSTYANVGYYTCGGVHVGGTWWNGSYLDVEEWQGFSDWINGPCSQTNGYAWFNANDSEVNVLGRTTGYSYTGTSGR